MQEKKSTALMESEMRPEEKLFMTYAEIPMWCEMVSSYENNGTPERLPAISYFP